MPRLSIAPIPINLVAQIVRRAAGEYRAGNSAKARHLVSIFDGTGSGVGPGADATIGAAGSTLVASV